MLKFILSLYQHMNNLIWFHYLIPIATVFKSNFVSSEGFLYSGIQSEFTMGENTYTCMAISKVAGQCKIVGLFQTVSFVYN